MKINILFFASLRESIGKANDQLNIKTPITAQQAWDISTDNAIRPSNTLIAVNQEYIDASTLLADGDELAFFPPVTGG